MNKVLIIEDELAIRESMCELLELNNYIVESAENGRKGLEKALEMTPDLVICDVLMPKLDGWGTLVEFKKVESLFCIPFIFLTAKSTMHDLRKGMNLGADDYLTKPFSPKELLGIISRQLKKVDTVKIKEVKNRVLEVKNAMDNAVFKEKIKNIEFNQSLEYAKKVQNVILPNKKTMNSLFSNYFGFFLPKDIISGDFFWVKEIGGLTLVAVADCTGHGVPAALLTMICYEQLNLTVERYGCRNPQDILLKTNELIIDFMKSNGNEQMNDGMDIVLCSIDSDYKILRFAGAKRPLYIVTDEIDSIRADENRINLLSNDKTRMLYEIKGDRNSIGAPHPDFIIKEQVFEYKSNDMIYLSSDGVIDQFGGNNIKRFKSKNFKQLLLSINEKDMVSQKDSIENSFNTWKGLEDQTDDVAVLGIKL